MFDTLDSHDSDDLLKSTLLSSTLLDGTNQSPIKSQTVTFNVNANGPEVSIYPLTLDFLPCYVNGTVTKKIILTNSGGQKAIINASILGDPAFSIQNSHVEIDSGKSSYILVRFQPFRACDSFASISVIGDANATIPVSGRCLKPPIELPDQSNACWYFDPYPNTKQIPITNTDLAKSFHLIITSNSPGFIVQTPILTIPPSSTININVRYEPEQSRSLNPQITVASEEASVKITRKLLFNNVKSTVIFDFHTVAVGTVETREFTLETKSIPKETLKSPFGFSITPNGLIFSFAPKRSGKFEASVPMDSVDILLKGSAMVFPLVFDEETDRLLNTTKETFCASLLSLTPGITMNPPIVEVMGNKSSQIKFVRSLEIKGTVEVDFECKLLLPDNDSVTMRFHGRSEAPSVTNAESQTPKNKSKQEQKYDNSSNQKYDISQNSPKIIQKSQNNISPKTGTPSQPQETKKGSQKKTKKHRQNQDLKPEIFPPLLAFFDDQKVTMAITGCDGFELEGPTWLQFPSRISADKPFDVKCPRLPARAHASDVTVTSRGGSTSVPVIAYRGRAALECLASAPLTVKDGAFECRVDVRNSGARSAFALMAAAGDCEGVSVSPPGAVIRPSESTAFKFRVEGETVDDIDVIMYWGDDILREMREVHFGELFGAFEESKEFATIKAAVERLDRKVVSKIFKHSMQQQRIVLRAPVRAGGLAVSPHRLRTVPGVPSRLSLLNMTPADIRFHAFGPSHVSVMPQEGIVPRYGELPLQISISSKASRPGEIEVRTAAGVISVPIEFLREERVPEEAFTVESEVIDFGVVEVRSKRAMNVNLSTLGAEPLKVVISSKNRNFHTAGIFAYPRTARAGQSGSFVVEFKPGAEMKYEEVVEISYKDYKRKVLLTGRGIKARCVGAECATIDFPSAKAGEKKICRIKVSNRSDRTCRVVASVTYPFSAEVSSFGVDAGSYVLFPVRFCPLTVGQFRSTLRFAPDFGKAFSVEVRGECTDDSF